MATGAIDANGIWQYGEDDSEPTFSALLNKLGSSTSTQVADLKQLGRVLQVRSATRNNVFITNQATFQEVPNTLVTITPRKNTNRILVRITGVVSAGATTNAVNLGIFRNTTNIGTNSAGATSVTIFPNMNGNSSGFSIEFLDSPATTSATIYKLAIASLSAGTIVGVGGYLLNTTAPVGSITTVTVEEIAA
jgi:hypothetical protein